MDHKNRSKIAELDISWNMWWDLFYPQMQMILQKVWNISLLPENTRQHTYMPRLDLFKVYMLWLCKSQKIMLKILMLVYCNNYV